MRKIRIVLYAFLACLLISTKAYAVDKNVVIYDDAELLSSDEYIQLEKYLKTLDSDINYLVVTTSSHDYGDSEDEILYTYYDESFGEKSDGIAFIVDMYDRRIHLSGYGEIQYKIKDADSIEEIARQLNHRIIPAQNLWLFVDFSLYVVNKMSFFFAGSL